VRHLDLNDAQTGGPDTTQSAFAGVGRVFLASGYDIRMLIRCKAAIDAPMAAEHPTLFISAPARPRTPTSSTSAGTCS
jgi:hypothetical protein